ncbi:MAG: hypothetical protein WBI14_04650 [Anaerolineaceae bacterium]
MKRAKRPLQNLFVLVSIVFLAACGGGGKKPNVPIPTVVAVLEKPYADVGQHATPTIIPNLTVTPSRNEPTFEIPQPEATATPQSPVINPTIPDIRPPTNDNSYPTGNVPTVSFQPTPAPSPTATLPSPTANPSLPIGLASGSAVFTLDREIRTLENQSFTAVNTDQSAVWTRNTAQLSLLSPSANCSGQSSSLTNSLGSGLNACLLSMEGSTLSLSGGNVTTLGAGSGGLFALGNASKVVSNQTSVTTAGDGARGASAENGGSLELNGVNLTTVGPNSSGVSINLGGSNAMLRDTVITTSGANSPCFYSNVTLRTENGSCTASQAEAAIVENNGSLELRDSDLASNVLTRWGVLLYQSTSRDARTAEAEFTMRGGVLNVTDVNSPVFFVTNVNAVITLGEVLVRTTSGVILKAGGQDNWGTIGENGGSVSLMLTHQELKGDIQTDRLSSVVIQMRENSVLEGAINPVDTARSLALSLDATSSWTLTRNSYVPQISGVVLVDNRVVNITGNNFNLYYDPALSSTLGGNTYQLTGGGILAPHP